jgi:hypothetical protein
MITYREQVKSKLLSKIIVDEDTNCWLWQGAISGNNYGIMRADGIASSVHRLSWEAHNGLIPVGLSVLHKCDNKKCINPDHLYLGTHLDNSRDTTERKQSFNATRTVCKRGHEFNEDNTYIRTDGRRMCRACVKLLKVSHG